MVAHTMQSTFLVANYSNPDEFNYGQDLTISTHISGANDYLPMARSKNNPYARGGAIKLEPQAPTARLDSALHIREMVDDIKHLPLDIILDKLNVRPLPGKTSNRTLCTRSIKPKEILKLLKSVLRVMILEKFR